MNILVTGATGRIGKTLIPSLLETSHEVTTLIVPDDPNTGIIREMGVQGECKRRITKFNKYGN